MFYVGPLGDQSTYSARRSEISAGPYAANPWTKIPVVMARQTTDAGWSNAQKSVPIHAMR